jgi:hypothetical protein
MIVRALFWLGYGWRGKAFAVVCAIIGLSALLSASVPYEPYHPESLRVVPPHACTDEAAKIITTREWRETWYQNIDTVRASAQWRDVNTGAYYPAFNGPTMPEFEHPSGTVTADIRLPVPRAPGEYRLHLQYDIEGGILLAPRHQDVPPDPRDWLTSTNTLKIGACQ